MTMTRRTARRPAWLLLALAAIAPPVLAQTSVTRTTPPESAVDAVFKRYNGKDTPGCSVAVIDAGKLLLKKSYGMADPSLGVPMTSSITNWIPYSEARVFVALAVAMLARDGKITLDDPIRKHVPQLPAYASAVTVRQLLHHTSGLADYLVLDPAGDSMWTRVSEDEFFRVLARWNKLGSAPGQQQTYSNTDYALLEMLVERVSGGSLHDYLHGKLLGPLGMSSTRIGANQAAVHPGHALFYTTGDAGFERMFPYRTSPVGGISVTTNLDDLIRWERALRDPASGVASMLKQLEASAPPPTANAETDDAGYSFGVYRRTHQGLPLVEYRGVSGYHYLVQVPETALSVATLCNAYPGMHRMGADVARLYAAPASAAPARTVGPAVDVPASELQRYVGEYRDPKARRFVDVTFSNGALVIAARGGKALPGVVAHGNGQFTSVIDDDWTLLLEFKEGEDGGMTISQWNATKNQSAGEDFQRWTSWKPDATSALDYAGTFVGDDVEAILHVRVEGDRVLVASHGTAETSLNPWDKADHFAGPDIYTTHFERDASGRVVALVLDAQRVKGMRYTKK
jgi:CubicO group peptidase (beta-lactamase class C family)